MSNFFDDYFNIKKMIKSKREYKEQMTRVKALPEDYQYVFKKIQEYMWKFTAGSGYDMMKIHYNLIELFESGAASGKHILEITGKDVAAFCDDLLQSTQTYTANWHKTLNHKIMKKLGERH